MRKEQYFIWIDLRKVGRREREDKNCSGIHFAFDEMGAIPQI